MWDNYILWCLTYRHVGNTMFTAANGDRPKKPNYNTLVLLTDGNNNGPAVNQGNIPANVDRVVVVGLGPSIDENIKKLATYPGDFFQAVLDCQIEQFLRQRILCEEVRPSVTPSTTCARLDPGPDNESSNS